MICGVQGDFTRSLVNDPPKTIWTRELKVCSCRPFSLRSVVNPAAFSLPVSPTRQRSTSVASVSAQVLVSELPSQRASNPHTGEYHSPAVPYPPLLTTCYQSGILFGSVSLLPASRATCR